MKDGGAAYKCSVRLCILMSSIPSHKHLICLNKWKLFPLDCKQGALIAKTIFSIVQHNEYFRISKRGRRMLALRASVLWKTLLFRKPFNQKTQRWEKRSSRGSIIVKCCFNTYGTQRAIRVGARSYRKIYPERIHFIVILRLQSLSPYMISLDSDGTDLNFR